MLEYFFIRSVINLPRKFKSPPSESQKKIKGERDFFPYDSSG